MRSPYEQAEDDIAEAFNNGESSEAEYRAEMRALRDELLFEAEVAAQDAHDEVMMRW